MKIKFVIIIIIIIVILILLSLFIIYHRDKIFYFNPKKIIYHTFDDFLKKYNGTKYKCKVGNVDIIDIPRKKDTNKIIVYFHGNYGNITMRERFLSFLSDSFKCRIVSVDYLRASNISIKKIVKITKTVIKQLINDGLDPENIIIWGESIGCAMGLETISVSGIHNFVMMAGFRRMGDMVEVILGGIMGKILKNVVTELDNEKHIETNKNLNIIVLHSKEDDLIPYYHIREMVDKLDLKHYIIKGTHSRPIISKNIVNKIKEQFKI
jgi:hypothetical protein